MKNDWGFFCVGNTYKIGDVMFSLNGYYTGPSKLLNWNIDMILGSPPMLKVVTFKHGDRQNYIGRVANAIWQTENRGRQLLTYVIAVKKLLMDMNKGLVQ